MPSTAGNSLPISVPPAADLDIHTFTGASISSYNSGTINGAVHQVNGKAFSTQRSAINVTHKASLEPTVDAKGRGIYYWSADGNLIIVNDNDIHVGTYSASPIGQISVGTERVTILETVGVVRLVILDAESNEGWLLETDNTLTKIASNFPTDLAYGGVSLDGFIFVLTGDGLIYNSNINNPVTWGGTDFITTARENDKGVYLAKHHDHLVAFSTRSIEVFYNAGNPSNSPLARRQDVAYNMGCPEGLAVWENGDTIYFVGSQPAGQLAVYRMDNFSVSMISNDSINSYLTQVGTLYRINLSGFASMGTETLLMTIYEIDSGAISPIQTVSYDTVNKLWGLWKTTVSGNGSAFPLMSWTRRTGGDSISTRARVGEGILSNGDIIELVDNHVPIDTVLNSSAVYVAGVYEDGVFEGSLNSAASAIDWEYRTGMIDGDSRAWKFQVSETLKMENTKEPHTLRIQHADENLDEFNAGSTIDTSQARKKINRGGRFMRRNYQLTYSGDEEMYLEGIDLDIREGV